MLSDADRLEVEKAQALLNNRRAEYAMEHGAPKTYQARPVAKPIPLPQLSQPSQPIKIWPLIVFAADKQRLGGAIRLFFIARMIDKRGSGKVAKAELLSWLQYLKVGDRKRRRWLAQAKAQGLIIEVDDFYYLVSLAKAALAVECNQVGRPAKIAVYSFVGNGWRAHVWASYLSTLRGRPMSQATKETLTGVSVRTQRNYQAALPGQKRRNYTKTKHRGDRLTMFKEHGRGACFVGRDGTIIFRLPDIRNVPGFIASPTPKGRSKKAQRIVNATSFQVERGNTDANLFRLFYEQNAHKAAEHIARKSGLAPWDLPGEVYQLEKVYKDSNLWQPVAVNHA